MPWFSSAQVATHSKAKGSPVTASSNQLRPVCGLAIG
jgi:hypothetical protein